MDMTTGGFFVMKNTASFSMSLLSTVAEELGFTVENVEDTKRRIAEAVRLFVLSAGFAAVFVETGVAGVEIALIQAVGSDAQSLTEALEVHQFPCSQKF